RAARARRASGLGAEDRFEAELREPPSPTRSREEDPSPGVLLEASPRSVESNLDRQSHARDAARQRLSNATSYVVPLEARAHALRAPRALLRVEGLRAPALQRRAAITRAARRAHEAPLGARGARALAARSRQSLDSRAHRRAARDVSGRIHGSGPVSPVPEL